MYNDNSPWDQPWAGPAEDDQNERAGGVAGGPRRRLSQWAAPRGASWAGGPPPWVQGLIGLAQSGNQPDFGRGRHSAATTAGRGRGGATCAPRSSTCSPWSR